MLLFAAQTSVCTQTLSKMSSTESHLTAADSQSVVVNEAGADASAGAASEDASWESKL
jgi:hypothetical protein